MDENTENQILEFIQNRHKKDESTASRHIHIRFDIEMTQAEKILETLSQKIKFQNIMILVIKKTDIYQINKINVRV